MNKKDNIEQEINKTLNQFDAAEKLPPDPYFFTRVQGRLDEKARQQNVFAPFLRPALIIALIAINTSVSIWYLGGMEVREQTNSRKELAEILAGDLELDSDNNNDNIIF